MATWPEQAGRLRCLVPTVDDQLVALDGLATATDVVLDARSVHLKPRKHTPNIGVIVQTQDRLALQTAHQLVPIQVLDVRFHQPQMRCGQVLQYPKRVDWRHGGGGSPHLAVDRPAESLLLQVEKTRRALKVTLTTACLACWPTLLMCGRNCQDPSGYIRVSRIIPAFLAAIF